MDAWSGGQSLPERVHSSRQDDSKAGKSRADRGISNRNSTLKWESKLSLQTLYFLCTWTSRSEMDSFWPSPRDDFDLQVCGWHLSGRIMAPIWGTTGGNYFLSGFFFYQGGGTLVDWCPYPCDQEAMIV